MKKYDLPTSEQVERELGRVQFKQKYRRTLRSTIFALITAAAAAVLVASLLLPVLRIYGSSMKPMFEEGQIVVAIKDTKLKTGDVVAFYYGNKVLLKRVIAGPGSWVNISEDGTVTVNDVQLDEPYITEKSLGITDLDYPYQVPEDTWFLMGDNRSTSVDSRSSTVGCVSEDSIIGKVIFRIWPLDVFGTLPKY